MWKRVETDRFVCSFLAPLIFSGMSRERDKGESGKIRRGNVRSLFFHRRVKLYSLVLFRICSISMNKLPRRRRRHTVGGGCNLASNSRGPIRATKRTLLLSAVSRYKKRSGVVTVPYEPRIPEAVSRGSPRRNLPARVTLSTLESSRIFAPSSSLWPNISQVSFSRCVFWKFRWEILLRTSLNILSRTYLYNFMRDSRKILSSQFSRYPPFALLKNFPSLLPKKAKEDFSRFLESRSFCKFSEKFSLRNDRARCSMFHRALSYTYLQNFMSDLHFAVSVSTFRTRSRIFPNFLNRSLTN